jgi:type IV secretory pathway TrbD component
VTAQQFIPMFVVLVFLFGLFIWFLGTRLYEKVPQRWFLAGVLVLIGGIIAGVVLMFQPFVFAGFPVGFWFVFLSLIGFMVWSHVQPRTRRAEPTAEVEEQAPGAKS